MTIVSRQRNDSGEVSEGLLVGVAVFVVLALIVGFFVLFPSYTRWNERNEKNQARQQAIFDARNAVAVSAIQIQNQEQRVKIAQQQADIRYQTAVGVRKAQDEISSTLTPLYVQFEMVQALQAIAASGKNATVVYIPSGTSGIPLISGAAGAPRVTGP